MIKQTPSLGRIVAMVAFTLSVFAILLYRQTGQDDVLVSGPFANRSRAEFDQLVGFFANTLVIRVRLAGNPKFRDLLASVRATVRAISIAATRGGFPFSWIPQMAVVAE
mgnify:CR=1 FL=1